MTPADTAGRKRSALRVLQAREKAIDSEINKEERPQRKAALMVLQCVLLERMAEVRAG